MVWCDFKHWVDVWSLQTTEKRNTKVSYFNLGMLCRLTYNILIEGLDDCMRDNYIVAWLQRRFSVVSPECNLDIPGHIFNFDIPYNSWTAGHRVVSFFRRSFVQPSSFLRSETNLLSENTLSDANILFGVWDSDARTQYRTRKCNTHSSRA